MKKSFIIVLGLIMIFAMSSIALANTQAKVSLNDIADFINDTTYIVVVEGNGSDLSIYPTQNADAYQKKVDKLAKMTPAELEKAKVQMVQDILKLTADDSNVIFPAPFVNYVKKNCPDLLGAIKGKTAVEFNIGAASSRGQTGGSVTANYWWGDIPTYSITFDCT